MEFFITFPIGLDIYDEELTKAKQHEHDCRVSKKKLIKPEAHPILRALGITNPLEYVRYVISSVKSRYKKLTNFNILCTGIYIFPI